MIKFKEKLKDLRLKAKLSQEKLAKKLCVSQRSISNWEKGYRQPDYESLETMTKFFDVSADYLLGLAEY